MRLRAFFLAALVALPVLGQQDSAGTRVSRLMDRVDEVLSKAGIQFGGEFLSQYYYSGIDGPGARRNDARWIETNEFTSVDFDIKARPNASVQARLVFRMHQNWQNFFSSIGNPINTRWISIDGNHKDMFFFNVGDFRANYSPLILQSPDIDILYEPAIFARARRRAMSEVFLSNNDRLLQGVNAAFEAEVVPVFNEFRLGILGSRLRNVGTDFMDGSMVTHYYELESMEKLLFGANLDTRFLEGIHLGASLLSIADRVGSFADSDTLADTLAQSTLVFGARPAVDIGRLLGNDALSLRVGTEIAASLDDSSWYSIDSTDTIAGPKLLLESENVTGTALRAGIRTRWAFGRNALRFNIHYIRNDGRYRNELAQSPSFVGSRIMNTENDSVAVVGRKKVVTPDHYSTFDALYNSVYKFVPSQETNMWHRAPFRKNSYVNMIFEQDELRSLAASGRMDPSLQLVMPFGPATANRGGFDINAGGAALDGKLDVTVKFASLSEMEAETGVIPIDSVTDTTALFGKTGFTQFGAGCAFDIASVVPALRLPLEISASYTQSTAKNDGAKGFAKSDWAITSRFANLGLRYQFVKPVSLLGGFQLILNESESGKMISNQYENVSAVQTQKHWRAGILWSLNKGADLLASFGRVQVATDAHQIPGASGTIGAVAEDFDQFLVDISLQVGF